MNQTPISTRW